MRLTPIHLSKYIKGRFYIPKVNYKEKSMEFYPFDETKLETNKLGITEPSNTAKALIPKKDDLIIIPSIAVDIEGTRLGYGGGFYDRYLERFPELTKIAINYEKCLQIDSLPKEEHDVLMDYVITEKRVIIEDLMNF